MKDFPTTDRLVLNLTLIDMTFDLFRETYPQLDEIRLAVRFPVWEKLCKAYHLGFEESESTINTLRTELRKANDTIAELRKQVPADGRERFRNNLAAQAMLKIMDDYYANDAATLAVSYADELIAELSKPKKE